MKKRRPTKKNRLQTSSASSAIQKFGSFWGLSKFLMPLPQQPPQAVWRLLPVLLFVAFVLRAAVALVGDFVIHPDEIMQYLEPAHQLVFGSGISFWEYYYGARSWLVPGFVAGILQLCAWLGLDTPSVYISVVKLAFCAISLLIPYGMYSVGRYLFGESVGRTALLLGVFWYELIAFAHKPMTEFVATALLFLLLAVIVRPPSPLSMRRAICVTVIGLFVVAVRFHYTPVVGLILLAEFLRTEHVTRIAMFVTSVICFLAIGFLDYFTWGNFFHSYLLNFQTNVYISGGRVGESSAWNFIGWLLLGSGGAILAAAAILLDWRRRHLWLLLLLLAILLPHMWESHREYRFIFAAIPLWLLLLADVLNNGFGKYTKFAHGRWWKITGLAYVGVVSLLGIANAIPFQHLMYIGYSQESGYVGFFRNQDPMFSIYRQLGADPTVKGVLDTKNVNFNTGGYYYLHKNIPFYSDFSWRPHFNLNEATNYVSHIVAGAPVEPAGIVEADEGRLAMKIKNPDNTESYIGLPQIINDASLGKLVYWNENGEALPVDGFSPDGSAGDQSIWTRTNAPDAPVKEWESYIISPDSEIMYPLIRKATNIRIRSPAKNGGIKIK